MRNFDELKHKLEFEYFYYWSYYKNKGLKPIHFVVAFLLILVLLICIGILANYAGNSPKEGRKAWTIP